MTAVEWKPAKFGFHSRQRQMFFSAQRSHRLQGLPILLCNGYRLLSQPAKRPVCVCVCVCETDESSLCSVEGIVISIHLRGVVLTTLVLPTLFYPHTNSSTSPYSPPAHCYPCFYSSSSHSASRFSTSAAYIKIKKSSRRSSFCAARDINP
jgi:hypothetical protein